jgi:hypothetical protein
VCKTSILKRLPRPAANLHSKHVGTRRMLTFENLPHSEYLVPVERRRRRRRGRGGGGRETPPGGRICLEEGGQEEDQKTQRGGGGGGGAGLDLGVNEISRAQDEERMLEEAVRSVCGGGGGPFR